MTKNERINQVSKTLLTRSRSHCIIKFIMERKRTKKMMYSCQCSNSTWYVHDLNNRGCVSVINGNYSAASDLFELALKKYREFSETGSPSSPPKPFTASPMSSSCSSCLCCCKWKRTVLVEDVDLLNSGRNNVHDLCGLSEHSFDNDTDIDDNDSDDGNSIDTREFRIQRITTTSQLRTISFPGQDQEEHQWKQKERQGEARVNHRLYHQVYRLPIVMSEQEWMTASVKDISFVLYFNTALCHHLWGMDLLEKVTGRQGTRPQHESSNGHQLLLLNHLCHRCFSIARSMYKFAMSILFSFIHGVDEIYYASIFNNMSHVCKTLDGYDSQDAHLYDRQLLKSVYWWKYSRERETPTYSPPQTFGQTAQNSSSVANPITPAVGLRSNSASTSDVAIANDRYYEDDFEIIDAFLENVFYLICARLDSVPAPVA